LLEESEKKETDIEDATTKLMDMAEKLTKKAGEIEELAT